MRESSSVLPEWPCRLLGPVTCLKRRRGHSGISALLAHVQWAPGCEASSCHSRVPTLKMEMKMGHQKMEHQMAG
ncbi:unnamed protein product, partial [Staurois parvus]